jgi:thiosulfate/3-mercaptopyruvate sulfurtransferase
MRMGKSVLKMFLVVGLVAGMASPAGAFLDNKFEKEVEKEAGAVKLVREVQRGGYDVVTTEELKKWIDSGKDMLIVDTMPYEDSYKKQHVPGRGSVSVSHTGHEGMGHQGNRRQDPGRFQKTAGR